MFSLTHDGHHSIQKSQDLPECKGQSITETKQIEDNNIDGWHKCDLQENSEKNSSHTVFFFST